MIASLLIVLLFLSAAFSLLLAWGLANRLVLASRWPLVGLVLSTAWWQFFHALELLSPTLELKIFWLNLTYMAVAALPLLWLIFVLRYLRRDDLLTIPNLALWSFVPLLTVALAWTNSQHGWKWRSIEMHVQGALNGLQMVYGPWTAVELAFACTIIAVSFWLLSSRPTARLRGYRNRVALVLFGALVPIAVSFVYLSMGQPELVRSLIPLLLGSGGAVMIYSMMRFDPFALVPVGRSQAIENLLDGVIIINNQQRVVDINPAAGHVLGCNPRQAIGAHIAETLAGWPEVALLTLVPEERYEEISLELNGEARIYELRVIPLRQRQTVVGSLLTLHDITLHKNTQESERQQRLLADALIRTSAAVSSALDFDDVLRSIVENVGLVVPNDTTNILLLEDDLLHLSMHSGYREKKLAAWLPEGQVEKLPTLRQMALTGQPMVIPDTHNSPNWLTYPETSWICSYVGAPIRRQGQVIGFLNLNSMMPLRYTQTDAERLQAFVDQAAVAIENARLYQEIQVQAAEVSAIYRGYARLLDAAADLDELGSLIAQVLLVEFKFGHAVVYLLNDAKTDLTPLNKPTARRVSGTQPLIMPVAPATEPAVEQAYPAAKEISLQEETLLVRAFLAGQIMAETLPATEDTPALPVCEAILPLHSAERALGAVQAFKPGVIESYQMRLLEAFGEGAALALQNALLYREARRQARYLSLLNEITRTILSNSSFDEMMQMLADRVGELMEADGCYITLWDEDTQRPLPGAAYGVMRDSYRSIRAEPGEATMTQSVLNAGRALIAEDVLNSPYVSPRIAQFFAARSMLGLPLLAGGQRLGAALVSFNRLHRFSPHEVELGEQAARQISLALAEVRSLELAERRAQEIETLRQAALALTSELDLSHILDTILIYLEKVIPYDSASVFLMKAGQIELVAGRGLQAPVVGQSFPLGNPLMHEILDSRQALILADAHADPRFARWGEGGYIHGWMGVPIQYSGQVIGFLTLDSRTVGHFRPSVTGLAEAFANQAGIAIENARLFQSEQRRLRQMNALHNATTALLTTLEVDDLLSQILESAVAAIPAAEKGTLMLVDEPQQWLEVRAAYGYQDERVRKFRFDLQTDPAQGEGYAVRAWRLRQPLRIDNVRQDSGLRYDGDVGEIGSVHSAIVAPLLLGDQALGSLSLDSGRPRAFEQADLNLLNSFAATATAAIRNAQLYAEVRFLATTDPLTGLNNRRALFQLADREVQRCHRTDAPLAVIMLDIDHFKRVNDTFGHSPGDDVLKAVANCCLRSVRSMDIVGRYGGEEFSIVLPETDERGALRVAERLRRYVAANPIETNAGPIPVTISLGVAAARGQRVQLEQLINRADSALYLAKQAGRNQVMAR